MASFSLELKKAVIDEYKTGRYTIAQVAKKFGVSELAVYQWVCQDKDGELAVVKVRPKRECTVDVDKMICLYKNGDGLRKIAEAVGCSIMTVRYHLLKTDIYEGRKGGVERQRKLTNDDVVEIVSLYNGSNMLVVDIAERFGVTDSCIRKLLKSHGVEITKRVRANPHTSLARSGSSPESVITDHNTGLYTHRNLADKYGVSTKTISRILASAGLKAKGAVPRTPPDVVARVRDGVLADLAGGMTVYEVAERHGIPVSMVDRISSAKDCSTSFRDDGSADKIVALHEGGRKMTEIASELGVSVYSVRKVLVDRGIGTRMVKVDKRSKRTKADKARDDVLASHGEGLGVADIAARCGVSISTVRKILREAGVVLNGQAVQAGTAVQEDGVPLPSAQQEEKLHQVVDEVGQDAGEGASGH